MNKKQRLKNRETAEHLARWLAPECQNCGKKGPHWVAVPMHLYELWVSGFECVFLLKTKAQHRAAKILSFIHK